MVVLLSTKCTIEKNSLPERKKRKDIRAIRAHKSIHLGLDLEPLMAHAPQIDVQSNLGLK